MLIIKPQIYIFVVNKRRVCSNAKAHSNGIGKSIHKGRGAAYKKRGDACLRSVSQQDVRFSKIVTKNALGIPQSCVKKRSVAQMR